MTAVATSGTVDCSGLVGGILQRFRAVGTRIAEEVEGDPGTVRAASQKQQQQSQGLSQLSQQARRRSTTLASSWEGGAYDAYAAKMGRTCDQLDQTAQKLALQSQKLEMAADALESATQQMTAVLADFDGKANHLIALAHTSAPGAVNAFVQAANTLGHSLVDAGEKVRDNLSRSLDVIAGNDPTKPEGNDHGSKTKLDSNLQKWLGQQDWFTKWYARHGAGTDPTKPQFGALDHLNTDLLDELMGKKPDPTTALGKAWEKTNVTAWKWDNDGKPLWEWGVGDKGTLRTDLPGGGAAGLSGGYFAGPQVTADAKAGLEGNQAYLEANAKATVLDAKGNAYVTYGPATAQAAGEVYVGANADANLKVGLDGASAHAGAFAGGKAEASVAGDVGGIGAGVSGSVRYGVGAELDAKATWEHGHIQIGLQAGAAVGLGGSIGGSVGVDLPKVWETYEHYDPVGAQALRDGAAWVGNTAHEASDAVGNAIDWLGGH
ncbi:WXG100 family type VII secretion target [Jatrophihabitans sp. YIM 134969]